MVMMVKDIGMMVKVIITSEGYVGGRSGGLLNGKLTLREILRVGSSGYVF
jgi:hypothetical protein